MLRKTFLNITFVIIVLSAISYGQDHKIWQPIRLLGAIYPRDAQFAGIEGVVEAKCSIREDGSISNVEIVSGHIVLARYVKTNLLQWVFQSGEKGENGRKEAMVRYSFQLKGSCDSHRGCKQEFWFEYPNQVSVIAERPYTNN